MPRLTSNAIELEYDTFGAADGEPLVLIMGLGAQMVLWDPEFCALLADRGFYVVRFDNRDIGLSTHLDHSPPPNIASLLAASFFERKLNAPYLLRDMADDTAGLIRGLGLEGAHIVGASMGGMIAQCMAIEHATLVRSLTSIMSTTGERDLPRPKPKALAAIATPVPPQREKAIARMVKLFRTIGSTGYPYEEDLVREVAGVSFDRSHDRLGVARQMAAIVASGGRKATLRAVNVPTLVVHGDVDPLVPPACGVATAEAIDGAEMLMIPGMGHDMPRAVWPQIVDGIERQVSRAKASQN